jgi:hypothetical protein
MWRSRVGTATKNKRTHQYVNTGVTRDMKQYVGISKDHSGSMSHLRVNAAKDYNSLIASIKVAAATNRIDTIVNVVKNGIGPGRGRVEREVVNSNVQVLQPVSEHQYITDGHSTPLLDSVGDLIEQMKAVPDYNDLDVSFLVMVITDGQENSSTKWYPARLAKEIQELQASDRWTFVFRVPKGYTRYVTGLGISEYNVLEWEQTKQGLEQSSEATQAAVQSFYTARASGVRSTSNFYSTNLNVVSQIEVKSALVDISKEVKVYSNILWDGIAIKELFGRYDCSVYVKGTVFYELTKREKAVQDYKVICILDKKAGKVYSGRTARDLLGLPHTGTIAITPGNHGDYKIFIQSTSVNRKIPNGTSIMHWNKVRVM